MKLETIKDRVGAFVDSVAEGWHHLRSSAANALSGRVVARASA